MLMISGRASSRAVTRAVWPARTSSQVRDRRAVDECFQLRPAVEAVRSREHELRVVEREGRGVGVAVVQGDLGHRVGVARAKRGQEFLGLVAPELIEIGMRVQRAGWCGVA
jgi:hypothetical protein